jgi:hypothetical protein
MVPWMSLGLLTGGIALDRALLFFADTCYQMETPLHNGTEWLIDHEGFMRPTGKVHHMRMCFIHFLWNVE